MVLLQMETNGTYKGLLDFIDDSFGAGLMEVYENIYSIALEETNTGKS